MHKQLLINRDQGLDILNELIALMTDELQQGTKITVRWFGTFYIRHKKARMGCNPKTKQKALISAQTIVSFKPALAFEVAIHEYKSVIDKTS